MCGAIVLNMKLISYSYPQIYPQSYPQHPQYKTKYNMWSNCVIDFTVFLLNFIL